ncbi:MAG: hypothetical protein AW07_01164 [Candidatus Accumulibacter sp. SK-11]|nr:MAG: hypothetical protein AW07_01164 [Candidatus Accumulibacter sp. SK-11]
MGREVAVRTAAVGVQIAILEAPLTLGEHHQRLCLVGLDRNDRLLEHGFRLGGRSVLCRQRTAGETKKSDCRKHGQFLA